MLKIIADLSYQIQSKMPVFPGDAEVKLKLIKKYKINLYNLFYLSASMHAGTHIDMPSHLTLDNKQACDFAPELFCAGAVMLDYSGEKIINYKPEYKNLINQGDAVLIKTNYADLYKNPEIYFIDYPVISQEFAEFLCDKKIKMLGLDTPSPDKAPFDLHKLLLENNIFIIENLTNLSALDGFEPHSFEFMALPLKIQAEASLVRAVAVMEEKL